MEALAAMGSRMARWRAMGGLGHLDWSWVTGAWKGEVEKVGLILLSTPLSKPLLDSLWSRPRRLEASADLT